MDTLTDMISTLTEKVDTLTEKVDTLSVRVDVLEEKLSPDDESDSFDGSVREDICVCVPVIDPSNEAYGPTSYDAHIKVPYTSRYGNPDDDPIHAMYYINQSHMYLRGGQTVDMCEGERGEWICSVNGCTM